MTITPFFKWLATLKNTTLKLNPDMMQNAAFYFTCLNLPKAVNRIKNTVQNIFIAV